MNAIIIVAAVILLLMLAVAVCSRDIDSVTNREYHNKGDNQ